MIGKFVGKRMRRNEDPRLVRGLGRFIDDIGGHDLAYVAMHRSIYAHARFTVDGSAARAMPGVHEVFSGADLGAVPDVPTVVVHPDLRPCSEPAIASDLVRYVGQVVAAVIARDPYVAADAAEAVTVAYDPLDAVVDVNVALQPGAPILHEGLGDNLAGTIRQRIGDPDAIFERADVVVSGTFVSHRHTGQPLEPRGSIAEFDRGTGVLTLWSSTQWPHTVRDGLRQVFDLPEHRIRIVAPDVGGGFGIKQDVYPEEVLLCLLAMRTGRRLKWTETRSEHFVAANHSRQQEHDVELAATADGIIQAMRVRVRSDMGAYTRSLGLLSPSCTTAELPGPYRIRDYSVIAECVLTNKTPIGVFRGAGLPEAVFATERAVDRLAARLGLDPAEVRRRNFIRPDEFPWETGLGITQLAFTYDSGDYEKGLDRALESIGYASWRTRQAEARAEGRSIGIGIASFVNLGGLGPYEVGDVLIDLTGRIRVITGASPHGQGLATAIAQVVAGVFDSDPTEVDVIHGDTALLPFGMGTYASRSGVMASSAALQASERVRDKMLALAGRLFEASISDLEVRDGAVQVIGSPNRRMTLAELASAAAPGSPLLGEFEPGLEARSYFDAPLCTFSSGTHIAVVEIDRELADLRILDYVVVTDAGTIINPLIADGQVVGGLAQGLGGALSEELVYDDAGQLLTTTYVDYLMPRAPDTIDARIEYVHTPSPLNPLGLKGLGETGIVGVAAAVTNAAEDALRPDVEINSTPLSGSRLFELIAPIARG